jgi:hypothetical protein
MTESDYKICAVCGRVLNLFTREGERTWLHALGDETVFDHPPVPIDPEEAPGQFRGRCDFCYAEEPTWQIPVRSFELEDLPGHGSAGDWAACDACMTLIERNDWNGLVRRVVTKWEQREGIAMLPEVQQSLRGLYRKIRRNITGAPRRIEE